MDIRSRINALEGSTRVGLAALALGILSTVVWIQDWSHPYDQVFTGSTVHASTGVELNATLSHPQVVQGEDGTIYLDLAIVTPERRRVDGARTATDLLIVLDRSGSMGEGSKWMFATRAVHSVLDRLTPEDRVALVAFDTQSSVVSGLVQAKPGLLARLRQQVDALAPGASTNLGDALYTSERLFSLSSEPGRRRRVLLLSDGQANVGIVDPEALGMIARRIADRGAVVSTIGMGLGFNETLMASLADLGMGKFSYLEHLESLGAILADELQDSRTIFAEGSEIQIELPEGVKLLEAAGYPFEVQGQRAVIRTGQLLRGTGKRFMATLQVPSSRVAEYELGVLTLAYRVDGRSFNQQIQPGLLRVACVAPEFQEAATASIDKDVYREAWIGNNLGVLMRQVGDFVRSGRREDAAQAISDYRDRLDDVNEIVPGLKKEADEELKELAKQVDFAFSAPDAATEQNRAAKSLLGASQERQRRIEKKRP